jgi:hypothetical protein
MGGMLGFDGNRHNFMVGADGGEYYVDNLLDDEDRLLQHKDKVLEYMKEKQYSEDDQKLVKIAFGRLQVIKDQTS